MHTIIIVLNTSTTNVMLSFKQESTMQAEYENIHSMRKKNTGDNIIVSKDDYGHLSAIYAADISAVLVSDLKGEYDAQIEKKLLEQHAGKRLQDKVASDPVLKLAAANIRGFQQ